MAEDEEGTLRNLGTCRMVISDLVAEHGGRVFGTAGDSVIVEFASAVNAVRAGVAIQRALELRNAGLPKGKRMDLRIGINLGDVVAEGDDLFGDGVNVAARLQEVANTAGICISSSIREQIEGKLQFPLTPLGERLLKNILRPISVCRVDWAADTLATPRVLLGGALTLPDRPSIAVLPFTNMSGDPEQEYFADGMVEEIITALSQMRRLFVIARNSSFVYKNRVVDVKQVGFELGVRYVLEGSVRKGGDRVRITAQLLDTSTATHLWADRFDGELANIFDLQDQVTSSVIGAIAPKLEQAEIERTKRKPTESLDAYDYFLRGMAAFHQWTKDANNEALTQFSKAIELDPNFAAAYGLAARCYAQRKSCGWVTDRPYEISEAERLARRAAELGRDDAVALSSAGIALQFVVGDLHSAADQNNAALMLNPNLAWAWLSSGWVKIYLGEPEVAIVHATRAMRLSPQDPQIFSMQTAIATAHFFAGRYAEALSWAELATRQRPDYMPSVAVVAASAALIGQQAVAEKALAGLLELVPELCISNLASLFPLLRSDDFQRWVGAMQKAGLAERATREAPIDVMKKLARSGRAPAID